MSEPCSKTFRVSSLTGHKVSLVVLENDALRAKEDEPVSSHPDFPDTVLRVFLNDLIEANAVVHAAIHVLPRLVKCVLPLVARLEVHGALGPEHDVRTALQRPRLCYIVIEAGRTQWLPIPHWEREGTSYAERGDVRGGDMGGQIRYEVRRGRQDEE